ncbi:MAG: phosphomannomutase [Cenarchaeum sp. SB0662_bin_33]|nr:phosphomannomutase [Cenarchaeum sp. SB0662_bin_33]
MKITISGIRGVVGHDYTLHDAMLFCRGFAGIMYSKTCVVGRDTRPTSKMISDVISAVLTSCDVDVLDLGVMPTPVVFRESQKYGSGIVITASHNPIEWNGLKFILNGRMVNTAEIDRIKGNTGHASDENSYGSTIHYTSSYVDDVFNIIGYIDETPSILIDAGGGAATDIAPDILKKIGCRTGIIYNKCTRTDPTADNLERLVAESTGYDAGVAFDTDGDRLVLVMNGMVQLPDATLGLGVASAIRQGHRKFVISMDTSTLIERYIRNRGGIVWRAPVGEANVIDKMIQNDASAGGEGSSGGFIFNEFNHCRDGLFTSALIASMIPKGIAQDVLREVTGSTIIREKVAGYKDIQDKIMRISTEVDTTDGIRGIIDEDTWVLIRRSNTEDVTRLSVEAPTPDRCRNIINQVRTMIHDI